MFEAEYDYLSDLSHKTRTFSTIAQCNDHFKVKDGKINILHMNIRSIYENFDEALTTISQLDFVLDIIIFTEC